MIDIGANLASSSFDNDLSNVLSRAFEADISKIIVTGSCQESNRKSQLICDDYPGKLYSTAGLHPHHAKDWNEQIEAQILELAKLPSVVAIGETGLDYNRNLSSQEQQRLSFGKLLTMAAEHTKPLFLHQRDAHCDFYSMLSEHDGLAARSVVHCFTDTGTALEAYLELGTMIGITGWLCDKKRGQSLRDIVHLIPDDRLMIETDAPYLMPHRDKVKKTMANKNRNEPCTLNYVAEQLGSLRGQSTEHIKKITRENAERFFGLIAI